jgi:hypothetical protein
MIRPDDPPTDPWVDDRVVVRRSPIEGNGLFAQEPIAEGSVVIRLGGRLVTSAVLTELIDAAGRDPDAPYVDTITVDEGAHLVLPPGTDVHFGNHSCDPNLWHVSPYELTAPASHREWRGGYARLRDELRRRGVRDGLPLWLTAVPESNHERRLATAGPAGPVRGPLDAGPPTAHRRRDR